MLKKSCPYHKGSVNHTLEQCEMLKKYYNRVAHRDEDKKKDADDKGGDDEFPLVENAFFIFGGATTNMTSRQRKRERREVFSVTKATPSYLDWSKDTITFGREDHPDYVPHPGRYPLVVDPSSATPASPRCSWTEAAASTSCTPTPWSSWGSDWTSFAPASHHSMALCRGSESNPSARSICLSTSARQPTSTRRYSL